MAGYVQPVLVGAGQLLDRPADPAGALSPMAMMQSTAEAAAADAGLAAKSLSAIDTLVVVSSVGPQLLENPPQALARRIGAEGAERFLTVTGGNTPQSLVNHFAEEIASGRRSMVLLSGAEALDTLAKAAKSGVRLNWQEGEAGLGQPQLLWPHRPGSNDTEKVHGMVAPIVTYPLFENALRRYYGLSTEAHQRDIGKLFAPFTEVASTNPCAWFPTRRSAEQIATVSADNRYVGFPYTKYMNAVMQVNQSASVILMSDVKARELGIDESRWIYLHGHCDINDIWHVSERVNFHSSPALNLGLESAFDMAGTSADEIEHFDVYSCFPAVVEVTRDALGMSRDDVRVLTVTGGLPYFGGAGNNYSMHAIAAMMDRLRSNPGEKGLVTANGWYLTKHALGIYSTARPEKPFTPQDRTRLQAQIDEISHPRLDPEPQGSGSIETFTVMFGRDGRPEQGLVLGNLTGGARFVAFVPPHAQLLEDMTVRDPIGRSGKVSHGKSGNLFEFSA